MDLTEAGQAGGRNSNGLPYTVALVPARRSAQASLEAKSRPSVQTDSSQSVEVCVPEGVAPGEQSAAKRSPGGLPSSRRDPSESANQCVFSYDKSWITNRQSADGSELTLVADVNSTDAVPMQCRTAGGVLLFARFVVAVGGHRFGVVCPKSSAPGNLLRVVLPDSVQEELSPCALGVVHWRSPCQADSVLCPQF